MQTESEDKNYQSLYQEVQVKLDRLQNDIDFIKNHMCSYLGNGTGLTHLIDETPIYINTNDIGCPSNFINGGKYEEEYYHLLASFRKSDSIFLDIGANLGVFSLRMAPLLGKGSVYAFEPNPTIHELFFRSVYLNGYRNKIKLYKCGASDKNDEITLYVPAIAAGGASSDALDCDCHEVVMEVRKLDELLADLNQFHIAKIDVEGHELNVLLGMEALISRSVDAVIIFEKLHQYSGIEEAVFAFLKKVGMVLYRIDGMKLVQINLKEFTQSESYFFAARPATVGEQFLRNFITIYPDDLYAIAGTISNDHLVVNQSFSPRALLFHGPYWYLQRGYYNMTIDAT